LGINLKYTIFKIIYKANGIKENTRL
jgi:hypothetical protein